NKGGALKSNDLLSQYIPEAAVIEDDISLENLIYHTSGLPCLFDIAKKKGMDYFSEFKSERIIAGIFEERHLHFTPGTKHEYSNTGYI
ncbi:serine hydrolase, partial [Staphylococcus aureus]|uniref:serine hydrolase n=1 Tax=Staphylococcus aureus TaxID=1280 RepID=UPI004035BD7F